MGVTDIYYVSMRPKHNPLTLQLYCIAVYSMILYSGLQPSMTRYIYNMWHVHVVLDNTHDLCISIMHVTNYSAYYA